MMQGYDTIAPFYDLIHGSRKKTINWIKKLIREYHPSAKTLLSVGCGTGAVCQTLSRRYELTGTDVSAGMLAEAHQRMPHVPLYQQDMVELSLSERFDVVVSLFGVLNHVVSIAGWEAFFERAVEHLNPGGILIFDILTELCLYNMVLNSPLILKGRHLSVRCEVGTDDEEGTWWRTQGFNPKQEEVILFDSMIRQVSFDVERVKSLLRRHFTEVVVLDPEQGAVTERSELVYFVCR